MTLKVLTTAATIAQVIMLGVLAYGKRLLALFLILVMLMLPHSAMASCRQFSIMTPDGQIKMCQDCNGQISCT